MTVKVLILEGLDGTGKTTTASNLIKMSTFELPIHYLYFPKLENDQTTIDYFYEITNSFKYLKGVVIMDRSILSTFSYGLMSITLLESFKIVYEYDPIIIYFNEIYDNTKLPLDYERIINRYKHGIEYLSNKLKIPVISTNAKTFLKTIDSLEKLKELFKSKRLPL